MATRTGLTAEQVMDVLAELRSWEVIDPGERRLPPMTEREAWLWLDARLESARRGPAPDRPAGGQT